MEGRIRTVGRPAAGVDAVVDVHAAVGGGAVRGVEEPAVAVAVEGGGDAVRHAVTGAQAVFQDTCQALSS